MCKAYRWKSNHTQCTNEMWDHDCFFSVSVRILPCPKTWSNKWGKGCSAVQDRLAIRHQSMPIQISCHSLNFLLSTFNFLDDETGRHSSSKIVFCEMQRKQAARAGQRMDRNEEIILVQDYYTRYRAEHGIDQMEEEFRLQQEGRLSGGEPDRFWNIYSVSMSWSMQIPFC